MAKRKSDKSKVGSHMMEQLDFLSALDASRNRPLKSTCEVVAERLGGINAPYKTTTGWFFGQFNLHRSDERRLYHSRNGITTRSFNKPNNAWFGDIVGYGKTGTKLKAGNFPVVPYDPSFALPERHIQNLISTSNQWRYGFDEVGRKEMTVQLKAGNFPVVPWKPGRHDLSDDARFRRAYDKSTAWRRSADIVGDSRRAYTTVESGREYKEPEFKVILSSLAEDFKAFDEKAKKAKKSWADEVDKDRFDAWQKRQERRAKHAYADAMADEDDLNAFVFKNAAKYGGKKQAEDVFRRRIEKELPPFFRNSKLSTKTLMKISKGLGTVSKIPIIGRTIANPMSWPVAALGAQAALYNASDAANQNVVSWQNAANLYGKPTQEFVDAAYKAGLKDPGQISRLWGKLLRFGDPVAALKGFGSSLGDVPDLARIHFAQTQHLDENGMAVMDILSKNGRIKIDKARATNANRNIVETAKTIGWSSNGDFGDAASSLWWSIPGMVGGQARDMRDFDYVNKGVKESYVDKVNRAVNTSISDGAFKESQASGEHNTSAVTTTNDSHNVKIEIHNITTPNATEFIQGLQSVSEQAAWSIVLPTSFSNAGGR